MASNTIFKDANWLLGEPLSPQKPKYRLWLYTGLAVFVVSFSSWPSVSGHFRERQYLAALKSANSSEEKATAIGQLAQQMPASLTSIVKNLASDDAETARLCYRAISDYLDKLVTKPEDQRIAGTLQVAKVLAEHRSKFSGDSKLLASNLASRIFANSLSDPSPQAIDIAESAEIVLVSGNQQNPLAHPKKRNQVLYPGAKKRIAEIDQPSATLSLARPAYAATDVTSILNQYLAFDDWSVQQAIYISHDSNVPSCQAGIIGQSNQLGKLDRFCYGAGYRKSSLVETSYLTERDSMVSLPGESAFSKMDTGCVVRFLKDDCAPSARDAANELRRRGMTSNQLKFAMDLANGSSEQRIRALDRIAAFDIANPIPWLVWMAQDGQRDVRLKAMSDLAKIGGDQALVQLRGLMSNERDPLVISRIRHLLTIPSATFASKHQ